MPNSMTGFGRALIDASVGRLTVEIQSVNRKFLEISLSLPKEFSRFEPEVRKWVADAVSRGQLMVRINLIPTTRSLSGFLPDVKFLKELKKGWNQVAKDAGLDGKEVNLAFLMQYLPALSNEASEKDLAVLKQCVSKALAALVSMKAKEGKALLRDLEGRLQALERMIREVEKHAPDAALKMRQRLLEKMQEALKASAELQERLLREVALFAERVDISEEITRFCSHISQFKELLKEDDEVGRKMDFLLQEMGREINTIGSKSLDIKISHLVVEMKSELEKMREQVQNIE